MRNLLSMLCLFLVLSGNFLYSNEVKEMPQLVYPKNLIVENDRILITDFPHVYLYSINNFKLIKKFGGKGEGPGEFNVDQESMGPKLAGLISDIDGENIYINSQNRLSLFNLNGDYIKVIRPKSFRRDPGFKVFKDGFVALKVERDGKKLFSSLKICNKNLKEIKEITRYPFFIRNTNQFRGNELGYDFFERANGTISFVADSGLIYVSRNNSPHIHIDVFNPLGKLLKTIKYENDKNKITQLFIKSVHRYYVLKFKRGLKANLKATKFKENFPGLRKFFVKKDKIYILTYKREGDENEIIILDMNGKFINKKMIPVFEANPEFLYPCSIYKGLFYQIMEVGEEEDWELHITKI